tara:strand:+ start:5683 stop:5901 length:219 start_codon:yes stop_codon:yes gene_type:complete
MATTKKQSSMDSLKKEVITLKANLIGLNTNIKELHAMCVTIHEIAKGLDGYEESLSRVKSLAEQNAKKTENV